MRIEFVGLSVGVSDLAVNYYRPQDVTEREKGANRIRVTVLCRLRGLRGLETGGGVTHCFGRFNYFPVTVQSISEFHLIWS